MTFYYDYNYSLRFATDILPNYVVKYFPNLIELRVNGGYFTFEILNGFYRSYTNRSKEFQW